MIHPQGTGSVPISIDFLLHQSDVCIPYTLLDLGAKKKHIRLPSRVVFQTVLEEREVDNKGR